MIGCPLCDKMVWPDQLPNHYYNAHVRTSDSRYSIGTCCCGATIASFADMLGHLQGIDALGYDEFLQHLHDGLMGGGK